MDTVSWRLFAQTLGGGGLVMWKLWGLHITTNLFRIKGVCTILPSAKETSKFTSVLNYLYSLTPLFSTVLTFCWKQNSFVPAFFSVIVSSFSAIDEFAINVNCKIQFWVVSGLNPQNKLFLFFCFYEFCHSVSIDGIVLHKLGAIKSDKPWANLTQALRLSRITFVYEVCLTKIWILVFLSWL